MTTEPQEGRLDDGLTVLRRVGDYEVLEEDGNLRPSSQVVIQGGPDGNVSVCLASETTPERMTRDYPCCCAGPSHTSTRNRQPPGMARSSGERTVKAA